MGASITISGQDKVLRRLASMQVRGKSQASASVVYDAPYAVYVHENLGAFHAHGQAKFIEEPARLLRGAMAEATTRQFLLGRSVAKAVRAAAEVLFKASQALVPVDTGRLKASGRIEVK